jgi:hypothetical protein
MEITTDLVKTYWHQIVMFVGLIWAASRKFSDLDRRIEINDTKTEEAETKIKELFRLHNLGIERLLRRLDKD